MCGNSMHENREAPAAPRSDDLGRSAKGNRTADMHVAGESDEPIVPVKRTNKDGTPPSAGRGAAEGNTFQLTAYRTQSRLNYHAIPGNYERLDAFCAQVARLWLKALRRRSHKARERWNWSRLQRHIRWWFPKPQILHPYPEERFTLSTATTQGRSRMR